VVKHVVGIVNAVTLVKYVVELLALLGIAVITMTATLVKYVVITIVLQGIAVMTAIAGAAKHAAIIIAKIFATLTLTVQLTRVIRVKYQNVTTREHVVRAAVTTKTRTGTLTTSANALTVALSHLQNRVAVTARHSSIALMKILMTYQLTKQNVIELFTVRTTIRHKECATRKQEKLTLTA